MIVAALTSSSRLVANSVPPVLVTLPSRVTVLPLPLARDIVAVAQRVLDVERVLAAGRFQQLGIGDGVAGLDREDAGSVDGAGRIVDQLVQVANRAGASEIVLLKVLQLRSLLLAPVISAVPDSTTRPVPSPLSVR